MAADMPPLQQVENISNAESDQEDSHSSEESATSSMLWDAFIMEEAAKAIQAAWRGREHRMRTWLLHHPQADRGLAVNCDNAWITFSRKEDEASDEEKREFRPDSSETASRFSGVDLASTRSSILWDEFVLHHAATVIQAYVRGWSWRKQQTRRSE